jgi:putative transcriptional regulator
MRGEGLKIVDRIVPGIFLVASPRLGDPNFVRSVILLCDHNTAGSWGLVVNRRLSLTFGDLLDSLPFPAGAAGPVHWGGPCDSSRLQVLHRLRRDFSESLSICRNVDLGLEIERLKSILVDPLHSGEALHGYVGYAGWGPGQLADELQDRSWILCTAHAGIVFDTPPESRERVLHSLGDDWARLSHFPPDRQWN